MVFNAAQDVHDAPVLQPGLVVEKPAQLLGEPGHGALGVFTGLEPVVMYPPQARFGLHGLYRRQGQHLRQQPAQLLLAGRRHEKIPEGAETPALVRIGDGVPLAHDLFQERSLGALPQGDAFAHPPVEGAEIVLHLAKIGEQLPRQL